MNFVFQITFLPCHLSNWSQPLRLTLEKNESVGTKVSAQMLMELFGEQGLSGYLPRLNAYTSRGLTVFCNKNNFE